MSDWFGPILDLKRAGYTLERIGHEIGVSTTTVWRFEQGMSEPRDTVATRLRALHSRFSAPEKRPA